MSLRAQRKAVAARAEATEGTQVDAEKVIKDLQEKVRAAADQGLAAAASCQRYRI